jgi:hypothetical protein
MCETTVNKLLNENEIVCYVLPVLFVLYLYKIYLVRKINYPQKILVK